MDIKDWSKTVLNFPASHADKIRCFAWFLNARQERDRFSAVDIRDCYIALSMEQPVSISDFLQKMSNRRPPDVLKDSRGYALERRVMDTLETRYGQRPAAVQVDKLLLDLPSKISILAEQIYLDEAIKCFRVGAFRATIVMVWNLSFDHFCNYIFEESSRLQQFNAQLPKTCPKKAAQIRSKDDFSELKESEVLQVARSSGLITNDLFKVLKEKLDRRNTAAHPSNIEIAPHTAEEFAIDLINNAVLKLV